jgi:thiol-disulfide isomerase/thioredoxin
VAADARRLARRDLAAPQAALIPLLFPTFSKQEDLIMNRRRSFFRLTLAAASTWLAVATTPAHAVGVGQPAPAFTLPREGGGTLSLADFAGKVVYVDFWASWCGPCRESFPWMNEMLSRYGDKGLQIVAVNVDAKSADASRFLSEVPARFPVVFDGAGKTPALYAIKGMPTSYLVGADGRVLMVHQSFRASDRADLEARIAAQLGGAGEGAR